MKKIIFLSVVVVLGLIIVLFVISNIEDLSKIDNNIDEELVDDVIVNSFDECLLAGFAVMESYPRQCRTDDGELFVEDIGNELEKADLIRIDNPRPNQEIQSPLAINGEARGYWFFEGDFPIELINSDGEIIVQGVATAKTEWMTEDFVQFETLLEFEKPENNRGTLILRKDNPSGLPENEDALEIPVVFK
ncbi:Gmad2 immunoglobulin-like domain-containing protein [Patescibacteria group bacterium]|nr:Gmad2 immunoglobulin-like domain-containing protein [Patescibacteria group bacterium]